MIIFDGDEGERLKELCFAAGQVLQARNAEIQSRFDELQAASPPDLAAMLALSAEIDKGLWVVWRVVAYCNGTMGWA